MITIVDENLVTDLRKQNVIFDRKAIDSVLPFIDINSTYADKYDGSAWNDIKDKTFLVSDGNTVIGLYKSGKFVYNPKKLKPMKALSDYDIFIVNGVGSDVEKIRSDRRSSRSGLIPAEGDQYPKSMNYVYDKDWDPEYNRNYYIKLLEQNKLGMYSSIVDVAYKTCIELIQHHHAEQTVGKRANVYNEKIDKLVSQIKKVENLIKKIDANFDYTVKDARDMRTAVKRLQDIEKECIYLLRTEDDAIRHFGYTPMRPRTKITK